MTPTLVSVGTLASVGLLLMTVSSAVATGPSAPPGFQSGDILGFEIEEEREYRLGPPEALEPGELAIWTIRLDRIEAIGGDRRATFTLQHRREGPRSLEDPPLPGEVTIAQVDATLVVNGYGAPLELSYISTRHIYDVGDEVFEVEYRYDGDHYKKSVALLGADWDFDVDLVSHENLDPRVPIGLFAFAPRSIECMEWLAGTRIERMAGTGDTGPAERASPRSDDGTSSPGATAPPAAQPTPARGSCAAANTDPAFSNPGLASLVMPLLWERRGDSEMVLFSPLRPDLVRGQDIGVPVTFSPIIPAVPGVPGSSILAGVIPGLDFKAMIGGGGTDGDKERARDPNRHFFPRHMALSERQRIDVGNRKMEALPLEISGYAGTVWIDDWGKVVRVDTPVRRRGDTPRWVRLLHASER